MLEQRALSRWSYARDFIERIYADRLGPLCAMRSDSEAMRLVAQALHHVENRIARLEHEERPPGNMEVLAAGVAIRPLGHANDRNVAEAEVGQHLDRHLELTCAAVDQDQIRALRHDI